MTPAEILTATAAAYRDGTLRWGRHYFVTDDGCRCAAGGITFAADPDDEIHSDGDPFIAGPPAWNAVVLLADYLVVQCGVTPAQHANGVLDPVETVGAWNDAQPNARPVIDALEGAAAWKVPA